MAARSERSPRNRKPIEDFDEVNGFASFLAEHRFIIGCLTAFSVTFSYVAANAIWYQPHAHVNAFFATRALEKPVDPQPSDLRANGDTETVIRLEKETDKTLSRQDAVSRQPADVRTTPRTAPVPSAVSTRLTAGDPVVASVQEILTDLNLYSGEVDGLSGPQTRAAIEDYRKMIGLESKGGIDDQLLKQLGAAPRTVNDALPLPQASPGTDMIATSSTVQEADPMVKRIQAGLKAFGNTGIEIDGFVGPRTKSAILEFQSLFGLPETGEPDQTLLAKMRDIGLTE